MRQLKTVFLFFFVLLKSNILWASHIVGGEVTYTCLGPGAAGKIDYEIKLTIYQDCLTGSSLAIKEDNPAYIAVYRANGSFYFMDSIEAFSAVVVPPNFSNSCVVNPPSTCLRKVSFAQKYSVPANESFYFVYQRCCRNQTILNIFKPGEVGATYYCQIPANITGNCNNSAVYKEFPPQIICINNPFVYDHSATDADGDSLSYEFCESYVGGSINDAKPFPPLPPPFASVTYVAGFTKLKPMAGNPIVQINPVTGVITGTPNISGRFVVTVCCNEWRNGVIINSVKREFQFVVTNCSKAVVANIPQYSSDFNTYKVECASKTVTFDNKSIGGSTYFWDFGVPNQQNDTSIDFSPTFTYPDSGTYVVKLIVNKGTTCSDSISRLVKVYPEFKANFYVEGFRCPGLPITFKDSSYSTTIYQPNNWEWQFGDGDSSFIQNPVHVYESGGNYNVKFTAKSDKGCVDSIRKNIFIDDFKPFAGNDTIIVKGEIINFNASGGVSYTWIPSTQLNNAFVSNPTGSYPDTGRFSYVVEIVSPNNCQGKDTINVWVVGQGSLFVPTAFSPNGDGKNDVLKPIGIGYKAINFFRVFNRWGQQVFYTTLFGDGWDGSWKGEPAEVGTYFWVLGITDRYGKEEMIKGDVALIR